MRIILVKDRVAGAVEFYIRDDINIELRLGNADKDVQGLDSIEWCGVHRSECRGADEDVVTDENMRWLQLLKEFNCTVTSTWTNNDDSGEDHTWRVWGSRFRKKRLHYIVVPRDLRSTAWYLNKVRLPVVEKSRRKIYEKGEERLGRLDSKI